MPNVLIVQCFICKVSTDMRTLSLCGCAYKNRLRELPVELWRLRHLEELNMNYCGLRELPAGLGQLVCLRATPPTSYD